MFTPRVRLLSVLPLVALVLAVGGLSGCKKDGEAAPSTGTAAGAATKSYDTKGVVKSFGPDKKFANIAHENIPGYMAAMTMSFEAGAPGQLDGLAVGDKVALTFSAEGSKHLIKSIKKEPLDRAPAPHDTTPHQGHGPSPP